MKQDSVTIVIDYKIYLYLFEPIIKYLLSKHVRVYIAASSDILVEIKDILADEDIIFINLSEIKSKNKLRFYIHRVLLTLCTREDFSFQYKKKRQQTTKKYKGMQGALLRIARFTPKIANKKINSFLHKIVGIGFKNPFPTKKIMVGSLNASAELLTAKSQEVITIMESWDHPVKHPNGYVSNVVLGWNKSLCEDWIETQSDKNVKIFHPMKLRYAHEKYIRNLPQAKRKKVMYAVSSTAKFSIEVLVEIEKKIILELIEITKELGWDLLIKPRPNGMDGEFDFALKDSHVSVSSVSHGKISNPANYYYSDEENDKRFSLLDDIDLVINAFTTFGLDAAVAGLPVLQLDLRQAIGFESSYLIYNNYHIDKYLINKENLIKPVGQTLIKYISNSKLDLFNMASNYSHDLRSWLYLYPSSSDAINECIGPEFNNAKEIKK